MGRPTIAAAVLATLFAATAVAPPALGGQATVTDATSDMSYITEAGQTIDAAHTNGDVSQVVVRHTRRAVVVTTFFVEMAPEGSDQIIQAVRYKTSTGHEWFQRTVYSAGGPAPDLRTMPGNDPVDCPTMQAAADTATDSLRVRIPRGCIERPRWVRIALTSVHYTQAKQWFDDAHKPTAYEQDAWVYTPRIRKPS
jgi:hypothetical protein